MDVDAMAENQMIAEAKVSNSDPAVETFIAGAYRKDGGPKNYIDTVNTTKQLGDQSLEIWFNRNSAGTHLLGIKPVEGTGVQILRKVDGKLVWEPLNPTFGDNDYRFKRQDNLSVLLNEAPVIRRRGEAREIPPTYSLANNILLKLNPEGGKPRQLQIQTHVEPFGDEQWNLRLATREIEPQEANSLL